jgi:hypothetical protein
MRKLATRTGDCGSSGRACDWRRGIFSSGIYNIGADDHHTKVSWPSSSSYANAPYSVRSRGVVQPNLDDPAGIEAGAQHYAALCVSCDLAG